MGYRKFKSDLLFTGNELLDSRSVLITNEEGRIEEIVSAKEAGDEVEIFHGLLCPGFINTHCHLELSHLKGIIPKGCGLVNFLIRVIKERSYPVQIIREAILKAEAEIYEAGTIAVADICNTNDSLFIKSSSNICWHNFIEVTGFTEKPEHRFLFASGLLRDFEVNHSHPGMSNRMRNQHSLTPHAPYSVSDPLFRLINQAGNEIVTIHNQESAAENQLYISKSGELFDLYNALDIETSFFQPSGKSSVQTYLPLLHHSSHLILVHNSFISAEDIQFIKTHTRETGQAVFYATCINANLYIESTLPPLNLLRESGCVITLGTDSYASNNSLNLLDEMRSIQMNFPFIPLQEILTWATINGAMALKLDKLTGSFEMGKFPGVVHINGIESEKITDASVSRRLI